MENIVSLPILQRAVHSSVTGVVIVDCLQDDQPLTYVNPAFERMTGYSSEECVGKNCRFLQGADTSPSNVDKLRQAIKNGEECKVVLLNYRKDGVPFWNELTISPVKDDIGRLTHFIGIQHDITTRIQARQTLIKAKEQAEATTKMKTDFLNIISHELRTPLTVMLGNLPLLTDADDMPDTDEIVEIATDIEESGYHLLELINELLDISKIEEGKLEIHPVPLHAHAALNEVAVKMQVLAKNKGLALDVETEDFSFMGDPIRVRQILTNLIGNAVKFTEKGGVTLRTYTKGGVGYFEVRDTGVGIKEQFLPYIFEVFRQVDGTATRNTSGSGLGLAITKKLIELHGGGISAESTYGEGSTFTVSFPLLNI